MRNFFNTALLVLVTVIFTTMGCASAGETEDIAQPAAPKSEVPGTIEVKDTPEMQKVIAVSESLNIADDEAVIYYYRADGEYAPKGFWLWRYGDGDGATNWEKSQNLEIQNDVAFFRFKKDGSDVAGDPIVNANGEFGFIVRDDSGWTDQTPDFVWNTQLKGDEVVFINGNQEPEAVGKYIPFFRGVSMESPNVIRASLSGHHALALEAADNGFTVEALDGSITLSVVDVVNAKSPEDRSWNNTDEILVYLDGDLPMSTSFGLAHPEYFATEKIDTANLVALVADTYIPPADYQLGAIYDSGSVEFRLWSPFAASVTARLFTQSIAVVGRDSEPDYTLELSKNDETGVWTATFDQVDPDGLYYDFAIDHGDGIEIALDPYAISMDAYVNEGGSGRGAIVDLSKAGPVDGWQGYEDVNLEKYEDAIIYEISVRDFTISPDADVVNQPGTFLAFIEKLDYLVELGVTHVQLLPVYNFYYTDEMDKAYEGHGRTSDSNYNWGYDPHNHFTPEGWYSSNPMDPYSRIREYKTLIKAIHQVGLGVIMDVVYNHMGSTLLLEKVVPSYYFRKNPDGTFSSNSGVGNDFASSRAMSRKMIVDSLVHWAEVYNVDGFRFDLMGLIDSETMEQAYAAVSALPGKEDILFQGEGWKMYRWSKEQDMMDQNFMDQTDNIAVFNDEIRNLLKAGGFQEEGKGFLTNEAVEREQIFDNLMGRPHDYPADDPGDSMFYVAAHDGLTLHDTLAHNAEIDYTTMEGKWEIASRAKLANLLLLTSQSIAFLHAGQERGRTKPNVNNVQNETIGEFVRNSYDSADNINQIVWTLEEPFQNLHDYTKGLIAIRKATDAFRIGEADLIAEAGTYIPQEDPFALSYKLEYQGETYFLAVNANETSITLDLGDSLEGAMILADGMSASLDGITTPEGVSLTGSSVTLDALSGVLLKL